MPSLGPLYSCYNSDEDEEIILRHAATTTAELKVAIVTKDEQLRRRERTVRRPDVKPYVHIEFFNAGILILNAQFDASYTHLVKLTGEFSTLVTQLDEFVQNNRDNYPGGETASNKFLKLANNILALTDRIKACSEEAWFDFCNVKCDDLIKASRPSLDILQEDTDEYHTTEVALSLAQSKDQRDKVNQCRFLVNCTKKMFSVVALFPDYFPFEPPFWYSHGVKLDGPFSSLQVMALDTKLRVLNATYEDLKAMCNEGSVDQAPILRPMIT